MRAAGGEIAVVSKDAAAGLAAVAALEGFGFRLLSDPELRLADAFGLRHVGADVIHGGDLARPAVLFFDSRGVLRDSFVTDNWRDRLDADEAVARIRALR